MDNKIQYNNMLFVVLATLAVAVSNTVFTLSGGEITINGAITTSYMDLFMNFTANVQWVAIIWSQNQADTDVTLFKANPSNPAYPVTIVDCNLDQNSAIQQDNVQNYMTSITGYTGDLSNGISAAFKRDLTTGDSKDIIIYPNSVIQICVICSTQAFVGGGAETGNQKDCSYISLHQNVNYYYDRMLGNYAGTSTFGGGNITVYATESTDGFTLQTWLFVSVVHKVQGLNPFAPRWLGILYGDSMTNSDMAVIQYNTVGITLDLHVNDFYVVNASFAQDDRNYVTGQGSSDVYSIMTAYDSSSYLVGTFKRKYSTGDVNRDVVVSSGASTYCVIYGTSLAFSTFTQSDKFCFNFTLTTEYTSFFRETSSTSVNLQTYVAPQSSVTVVTASSQPHLLLLTLLLLLLFFGA